MLLLGACAPPAASLSPTTPATQGPGQPSPATTPPAATAPAASPEPAAQGSTVAAPASTEPAPTEPSRMPLSALSTWGAGAPSGAAYRPDGAAFAVATAARLELRDSGNPERLIWGIDLPAPASTLAFAPDGATVALAVGPTVELRSAADGALKAALTAGGPVADIAFAPAGATLAAAAGEEVAIWQLPAESPALRLSLPDTPDSMSIPGALTSVAVGPEGQLVVGGDDNGNVIVWRAADGIVAQVFSVGLRVVADVAIGPDGVSVAAASEGWRSEPGAAWLWDISAGAEPRILTIDDGQNLFPPVERVAFAPDSAELAAGAADGTILRWSLPSGDLQEAAPAHQASVVALAYAPGGSELLSAARDGAVHLRPLAGGGERTASMAPAIYAVALSPMGDLAAAGGEDGTITLIAPDGSTERRFAAHRGPINALAVTPDGHLLISGGDDGLARLWALPGGEPRGELKGHDGPVLSAAVSADGGRLVTAGWDGTLRVWRLPGGEAEHTITVLETDGFSATSIQDVALSADGRTTAAAVYDGEVRLFTVADGAAAGTLRVPGDAWITRVAYAPEGGMLAALDQTGQVRVWGTDGAELGSATVPGATDMAWAGGRVLATAGGERGVQLWALGDGPLVALAAAPTNAESLAVAPRDGRLCLGSRAGMVELRALR